MFAFRSHFNFLLRPSPVRSLLCFTSNQRTNGNVYEAITNARLAKRGDAAAPKASSKLTERGSERRFAKSIENFDSIDDAAVQFIKLN